MAGSRKPASSPKAPARKTARDYLVVRVEGDTLTVLNPKVEAKHQQDAMDAVAATMPPQARNGVLGAFLLSSYREKEYKTAQEFITASSERKPAFNGNGKPQAVPEPAGLSGATA